jgi:hypothetical protein
VARAATRRSGDQCVETPRSPSSSPASLSDAVAIRAEKPKDKSTVTVTAAVTSGKRQTNHSIVAAEVTRMANKTTIFARP